jgi:precorrin-6Y C5,15-methyltransferase (decarboxylating)
VTPWLTILGIGEDGCEGLGGPARALLDGAEVLIGGKRHLALVPDDGRQRLAWPTPLTDLLPEIRNLRGKRVCVLATGDPLRYGVGRLLLRHFPIEEVTVVPSPSAFSLACARLGWSQPDTFCLTLHGRPAASLQPFIQPDVRLLILSNNRRTPGEVAAMLRDRGYGSSRITVLEHMGGPREGRVEATADDWARDNLADFNTVAVVCVGGPGARLMPTVPGLPDEAFQNDGQLTKREVRAASLAALGPVPGQRLWDVGAGCGAVAIEWLRAAPHTRAIAVERQPERVALIAANGTVLGTPDLEIVEGTAPAALEGLALPDAVFIGGGAAGAGLIEACWQALSPGGRLVANVVTLEGEAALLSWQAAHGGALTRLAISRAEPVGGFTGWRPLMPVTQLAAVKP